MNETAMLTTRELTIGYRRPKHSPYLVAEDINLSLHAGAFVCLLV